MPNPLVVRKFYLPWAYICVCLHVCPCSLWLRVCLCECAGYQLVLCNFNVCQTGLCVCWLLLCWTCHMSVLLNLSYECTTYAMFNLLLLWNRIFSVNYRVSIDVHVFSIKLFITDVTVIPRPYIVFDIISTKNMKSKTILTFTDRFRPFSSLLPRTW